MLTSIRCAFVKVYLSTLEPSGLVPKRLCSEVRFVVGAFICRHKELIRCGSDRGKGGRSRRWSVVGGQRGIKKCQCQCQCQFWRLGAMLILVVGGVVVFVSGIYGGCLGID